MKFDPKAFLYWMWYWSAVTLAALVSFICLVTVPIVVLFVAVLLHVRYVAQRRKE